MASKDVVLDVEGASFSSSQNELVFQEIPHTLDSAQTVHTHIFTNFPHQDDSDSDDKTELLDEKKGQSSLLSFSYYQSFFDVEARQVLGRILGSFFPNPRVNYLQTHIRPKPDFYGPFWVSTTLIMIIAISANLIGYFSSHGDFKWKYDFNKVTIATVAIYTYWLVMPLFVYLFLRWRGNRAAYQFSELICVYGYSLSIYIPVSILCLIPIYWLQWSFVLLGMLMSGVVLIFTVWPAVKEDKKQISFMCVAIVILMHSILAVGFMLYFFSPSATFTPAEHTTASVVTTTTNSTILPTITTKALNASTSWNASSAKPPNI